MRVQKPYRRSADPAPSPQFEFRVHETARDSVAGTFSEIVTEKSVPEAIEGLVHLAEELTARYKEVEPPASPIHCRAFYYRLYSDHAEAQRT